MARPARARQLRSSPSLTPDGCPACPAAASAGLSVLSALCVVLVCVVLTGGAQSDPANGGGGAAARGPAPAPPLPHLRLPAPPRQPATANISVIGGVAITTRMQALRPALGVCYERSARLRDIVLLWRERQSETALEMLAGVDGLEARHLAINIAQMHDMYDVIDTNANAILDVSPADPHALFVKALYAHAADQLDAYAGFAAQLRSASPAAAVALDRAVSDVLLAWDTTYPPPTVAQLPARWRPDRLAIVVFGCPVLADGTPSPSLQDRLDAALLLHARYPSALIIASGGAVRVAVCLPCFPLLQQPPGATNPPLPLTSG